MSSSEWHTKNWNNTEKISMAPAQGWHAFPEWKTFGSQYLFFLLAYSLLLGQSPFSNSTRFRSLCAILSTNIVHLFHETIYPSTRSRAQRMSRPGPRGNVVDFFANPKQRSRLLVQLSSILGLWWALYWFRVYRPQEMKTNVQFSGHPRNRNRLYSKLAWFTNTWAKYQEITKNTSMAQKTRIRQWIVGNWKQMHVVGRGGKL